MMTLLAGLPLSQALAIVREKGIEPVVTVTCAPKRRDADDGVLRVVYASDHGEQLIAARFMDPIAKREAENRPL